MLLGKPSPAQKRPNGPNWTGLRALWGNLRQTRCGVPARLDSEIKKKSELCLARLTMSCRCGTYLAKIPLGERSAVGNRCLFHDRSYIMKDRAGKLTPELRGIASTAPFPILCASRLIQPFGILRCKPLPANLCLLSWLASPASLRRRSRYDQRPI